jgi:hypothetical protein
MHELFDFAENLPYVDSLTNAAVIQYVGGGKRMGRPETRLLPDPVWSLMEKLWAHESQDRATARQAVSALKKALPSATMLDDSKAAGDKKFDETYARFVSQKTET